MPREISADVARRFWEKVIPEPMSGCWLWLGATVNGGYGVLSLGKRHLLGRAHRLSLEIAGIEIPPGLLVLHRCDTPPCVNPAHLFVGTDADNVADKIRKGRARWGVLHGEDKPQAKLTSAEVVAIREQRQKGATYAEILAAFGISKSQLINILSRRQWKEVA